MLQFLIMVESEQTEQFFEQFKQNNNDLLNLSNLIKYNISNEKSGFLKKLNLKSSKLMLSKETKFKQHHYKRSATDIYHICQ